MADAPPPESEAPPTRGSIRARRERLESAKPARGKSSAMLWLGAGLACAAVVVFFVVRMLSPQTHTLAIDWPVGRAGGEAVAVRHAVKAGDRFDLRVQSDTGVVLGDAVDPMQGMKLTADMTWEHAVAATDDGRLRSTVAVRLGSASGDLPAMPSLVTAMLGGDAPLRFTLDRDASGAPVAGSGRVQKGAEDRRMPLEYLTSGLSDLSANYLPARDVKVGEVWDIKDCAKLGQIVEAIRLLATLNPSPKGFPA